jgi:hypothetical protein
MRPPGVPSHPLLQLGERIPRHLIWRKPDPALVDKDGKVSDGNLSVTLRDVILNYGFACRKETIVQRRIGQRPELEGKPT